MDWIHLIIETAIIVISGISSAVIYKWKQHQQKKEEEEKLAEELLAEEKEKKERQQALILRNLESINTRIQQIEVEYQQIVNNDAKQDECIKEIKKDVKATRENDLAVVRYLLLQAFSDYRLQGYADTADRETVSKLMTVYEENDGDGFIHELYDKFKRLPYEEPELIVE